MQYAVEAYETAIATVFMAEAKLFMAAVSSCGKKKEIMINQAMHRLKKAVTIAKSFL